MEPFDRYPHGGKQLLGQLRGANARREYGLRLQRLTGISTCAYCRLDLTSSFEHWLLLCVDHVVPTQLARSLGIPKLYYNDMANCVLSCSACNGLDNRYTHAPATVPETWDAVTFVAVRDRIFAERFDRIGALRAKEQAFFDLHPWDAE